MAKYILELSIVYEKEGFYVYGENDYPIRNLDISSFGVGEIVRKQGALIGVVEGILKDVPDHYLVIKSIPRNLRGDLKKSLYRIKKQRREGRI
ncbi:hypothetical protein CMI44_00765 [Candidatus Pacearchaeota archaeon]|nr:hypothetical protein [Candidatus Pacearchaeota archaeon]|tara:strand:+ start:740 stop:1018 length:279 start_codon:yes stop_codon:yes gene_type:complete